METRANHIWVGAVTLLLLAGAIALALWIARLGERDTREYDIFFSQSVEGLSKGSAVSYSGVAAGQVKDIALWGQDPGVVRVRIALDAHVPVLESTRASLQGNFTGVSTIVLSGGVRGEPRLDRPGRNGVPEIQTRSSGLGALLSNAPALLTNLTTLAKNLNEVVNDRNRKAFGDILTNTNRLTASLATTAPQLATSLADLDAAIVQARETLATLQKAGAAADATLGDPGNGTIPKLHAAIDAIAHGADAIRDTVASAKPGIERLNGRTLPEAEATLHDLAEAARSLRAMTDDLHDHGLGGLVGGPRLPDYRGH